MERLGVLGCYMPPEWWVDYFHELACMGQYDTLLQYLYLARKHHVLHLLFRTANDMKAKLIKQRKVSSILRHLQTTATPAANDQRKVRRSKTTRHL